MSTLSTLLASLTVPIMYELGKVRGNTYEQHQVLKHREKGLANTRKWESYGTSPKETEYGIPISRASDASRSGRADQSGKGIGPLWPTRLYPADDHVPARPESVRG